MPSSNPPTTPPTTPPTATPAPTPPATPDPSRRAAFRVRNFRLYFIGQTISSVGSWLQALAMTWLILDLTNRSDRLGIVMALQFLPMLLLGVPAGLLADRFDNRRILVVTSAISGVVAAVFGLALSADRISTGWIYVLAATLGLVLAVERPAMQTILYSLVGPKLLPNAVAANSTSNSIARLLGPAIGGALIAGAGIEACFFVNAASYVVVIAALALMRSRELIARPLVAGGKGRIRDGLRYVRSTRAVAVPLVIMTVVGIVVYNFPTTFPSMVRFQFHLGAGAVGTAMSVSAIGSLLGGIYIAGVTPQPRRTLALALGGLAAGCVLLAVAPTYWAFVVFSVPLGFASACFQSVNTVVVQRSADASMQGRVMALHQMAWFGTTPIGALVMGWVTQHSSPRVPFLLGGTAALVCALVCVERPVRRGTVRAALVDAPAGPRRRES